MWDGSGSRGGVIRGCSCVSAGSSGELVELTENHEVDVMCLQEIKASVDQLPVWLCDLEGYWCYWHGGKGYSGVGLHIRQDRFPSRPVFSHPPFDMEHRIVVAELPGVHLIGLRLLAEELSDDDPEGLVDVIAVRRIVAEEIQAFLDARRLASVTPTVIALRTMATGVVEAELEADHALAHVEDDTEGSAERRIDGEEPGRPVRRRLRGPP